ncbi:MAG: GAF domain-containing protein, partial [Terriglobales bacterium]
MSTLSATLSEEYTQRYEALLRATNSIGTCCDCDSAADMLIRALREVVSFDYLQLVTFDNDTTSVAWHLLYSNGARQNLHSTDVVVQGTPMVWVHESQQPLVTADWTEEARFPEHAEFLNELGIAATCVLPLARGQRRLGVLSVGTAHRDAYADDEVRFLGIVADQIALAIDAAVNFYLSRQAEDRLKLILEVTNQVVSKLNFQELLQAISASVRQVMHCDAAAIMLPTPDGLHLRKQALDFPESKGLFTED